MVNLELVRFLIENHQELTSVPLSGQLRDVFSLFLTDQRSQWGSKYAAMSIQEFIQDLSEVNELAPNSLTFQDESFVAMDDRRIEFIDVYALKILYDICRQDFSGSNQASKGSRGQQQPQQDPSLLDRFMTALDCDTKDEDSELLSRQMLLQRLEKTLAHKPASVQLGKERARMTVPQSEFIPVCNSEKHAHILSTSVNTSGNRIISIQWSRINKFENENNGFTHCLQTKIHYVPNLNTHTERSLGDCSYLDTCHKLNTCRYVHYLQYIPEVLKEKIAEETKLANRQINQQKRIPFYTLGNCCADISKSLLPPQWIRCDVRKFDFSCLGKFSAVIADPAWNIHMNLPYGTCNDIELLGLPLEKLQDEGILFLWVTGRAIDLGKESLEKWGYRVVNEISWVKTNQLGRTIVTGRTGHWLNHSKEHLLVGLKGNPQWLNKQIDSDIIVSITRETSRKPDELYGMIERLVGRHARKLEIFGRDHNKRPGWLTIGNQVTGTCIRELEVKKRYDNSIAS
ncbi:hypothetical protein ZYGR_0AD05760 [Zygosaccharomyces rouxii]|uniref:mRNA m(6)A methyltransferase n=2 Tax=Zygosaccharomyces rouxii TaxID=4956 RepID=C5E1A3_ZYGRC|nr:uncharacterized protein ZYRO0G19294g [Zygosaccharomyces rouxii]KAH9202880.1 MT-A70-domain-containing protein [Zygosaccharomyces rouxii]GAV51393.1 hypothetical protein ZYGR_0AD05760 [Zygosaccharomyces rouxii]CAR29887.1 ZYRO0G19294p [Zygosaccharomyces rouxii]